MNKNISKPPTPIATRPRKPLLNITNTICSPCSQPPTKHEGPLSRPQSTKSIKPRISIDEFSRPKIKQIHSRRSNRSDSQDSLSSSLSNDNAQGDRTCRNHRKRVAMYQVEAGFLEFFCLECSLVYAKQGYKIKAVNQGCEKSAREKEAADYLEKSTVIRNSVMRWRKQQNKAIQNIFQQYGSLISNEHKKMQEQLEMISEKHKQQIAKLQRCRQQKIQKFKQIDRQMQKQSKIIENTRLDIQRNYQDCIRGFNNKQYRAIMDQYWRQLQLCHRFLYHNSVAQLISKVGEAGAGGGGGHGLGDGPAEGLAGGLGLVEDVKMTVRTMDRSSAMVNQFTFSKQKKMQKFESPPMNKQLRGIKIVESYPDSNRYNSSMKESIVDQKINFSEFQV